jgi:hypothetical protein
MTVSIKIPGASFTEFFDYAHVPHVEDAQSLFLFGTDADSSRANQIQGAANPLATLIGTPTYGAGFATVTGTSNGFDTLYSGGNGPFTMFVLHKTVGGTSGVMGFSASAANKSVFFGAGDDVFFNQNANLRLSWTTAPAFVSGKFTLTAFAYDGVTLNAYRSQGTSTLDTTSVASAPGANPEQTLKIGGVGISTGATDVAAAGSFTRVLSQAEITEVYDYLKFIMPARGILVN